MFSHLGGYKGDDIRAFFALEEFEILFRWQINVHETVSSTEQMFNIDIFIQRHLMSTTYYALDTASGAADTQ